MSGINFIPDGQKELHLYSETGKPYTVSVSDEGALQIKNETTGESAGVGGGGVQIVTVFVDRNFSDPVEASSANYSILNPGLTPEAAANAVYLGGAVLVLQYFEPVDGTDFEPRKCIFPRLDAWEDDDGNSQILIYPDVNDPNKGVLINKDGIRYYVYSE